MPTRLIARLMSEFLLASARAWSRPHGGDLHSAIVYCTVLSANLDHLGYDTPLAALASSGFDDGAALRRPISANAVAQSLSLPYETVRRRISVMLASGHIARQKDGLIICPESLRSPAIVGAMSEVKHQMDDLSVALRTLNFDLRQVARMTIGADAVMPREPATALIARIIVDGQIRSLESAVPLFGSLTAAYVCTAIVAANVRKLLTDPALAWRYARHAELPPDHLRQPIPVRELAREIEMPFETVRRQVGLLLKKGVVTRCGPEGVIVPTAIIASEGTTQNHLKLMLEFSRMIGSLARAGYTFGAPDVRARQESSGQ